MQWINRDAGFRGYAGTVLGGSVRPGDEVVVLPSGVRARVERIVTYEGDLDRAVAGQAVTLTLDRPSMSAAATSSPPPARRRIVSDQFAAHIVWLGDAPMLPGRPYLLRLGTATTTATVSELKHRLDIASGSQRPAKQLEPNDIGLANLSLDRALPFDTYDDNRETGGFILIDRLSNATVGAGMIRFPLRRAANLAWQDFTVDKAARAAIKGHRPADPLVHRPVGLGQVDDRRRRREAADGARPPHLSAGRRQCPPRPQPRPGLHRCRPGRERPARDRDRPPDGRRRPDRAGVVHLAVPRRAAAGARAAGG